MKIESSTVAMASQSSYKEATKAVESLRTWDAQGNSKTTTTTNSSEKGIDIIEISEKARNLQLNTQPPVSTVSTVPSEDESASLSSKEEQQLTLLKRMIEALTKKKIKFVRPNKATLADPKMNQAIQGAYASKNSLQTAAAGWAQGLASAQPRSNTSSSSGGGFEYNRSITHYESQSTAFQAQASVTTADGRQINIDLQLNLSREFMSQSNLNIQGGNQPVQVDPLVINYDAGSASVTEQKYAFDIDANGTLDQISFVGPGSGFLALDLNEDGKINDGSELFGPQSGNGFDDLAKYDSDGNNWIDENDPIYDKLQIWSKDSAGNDVLMALGQKGVGAIYLGNVSTSFALKGADNQTNAQLQRTGIYLNEDGSAGTIQHIDLSI
ncbi:MAG: hypothetical protein PHO29_03150 [Acetobacterium sp.]|nr:hypothetical protein [Acetobacterium sp.]